MLPTTLYTTQPALGSLAENAHFLKTQARLHPTGPTLAIGNDYRLQASQGVCHRPAGLPGPLCSHTKRHCSLHPPVHKAPLHTSPRLTRHCPQVPLRLTPPSSTTQELR